jgi:hypothetical protein
MARGAMAGAVGFGLVACGGSSPGGAEAGRTASPGATASAAATTPGEETADISADKARTLTPPGKRLKLGQAAIVRWVPLSQSAGSGAKKGLKLKVVVDSIKKGKISDFAGVKLTGKQLKTTPYYVRATFTALGKTRPKGTDDPHIALDAIDDRDQPQGRIIVIGAFQPCDVTAAPKPFVSGKSYQTCLAFLVPGGGSIKKVEWGDGSAKKNEVTPYFSNPVVWRK